MFTLTRHGFFQSAFSRPPPSFSCSASSDVPGVRSHVDRGLLFDSIPAPAVHGTSLKVALALAMVCKGCELKFLAPCSCNKCDPTWLKRIARWYKTNTNNWYCCHCVQKGEWSVKIHDAHKIKKDYLICDEAFQYAFEWQTRVTPCRATDSGDQGAAGSSWPSWDPPPPPGQVRKTKKGQ